MVLWASLFVAVGCGFAQGEAELTPQEVQEAQETAQRFVGRMQQTRDVRALFDELFLPGFSSHLNFNESVSPGLYARLTRSERRRLFIAHNNFSYLSAVIIISDHGDMDFIAREEKANAKMLFPISIAVKFRRALLHVGETRLKSYRQFRSFLPALEGALADAQTYLKRRGLEQSAEFQGKLAPSDDKGNGINYRVRAYVDGITGFPKGRKFYRVELPLLMAVILTKSGKRMKIVNLTFVDAD